jgi:hypothetical protein
VNSDGILGQRRVRLRPSDPMRPLVDRVNRDHHDRVRFGVVSQTFSGTSLRSARSVSQTSEGSPTAPWDLGALIGWVSGAITSWVQAFPPSHTPPITHERGRSPSRISAERPGECLHGKADDGLTSSLWRSWAVDRCRTCRLSPTGFRARYTSRPGLAALPEHDAAPTGGGLLSKI